MPGVYMIADPTGLKFQAVPIHFFCLIDIKGGRNEKRSLQQASVLLFVSFVAVAELVLSKIDVSNDPKCCRLTITYSSPQQLSWALSCMRLFTDAVHSIAQKYIIAKTTNNMSILARPANIEISMLSAVVSIWAIS